MENIKSNEVTLAFSKIVSKGVCCDKVWGFGFFHLAHVSVVFTESRSSITSSLCADAGDLTLLEPSAWVERFFVYPGGHTWEILVAF